MRLANSICCNPMLKSDPKNFLPRFVDIKFMKLWASSFCWPARVLMYKCTRSTRNSIMLACNILAVLCCRVEPAICLSKLCGPDDIYTHNNSNNNENNIYNNNNNDNKMPSSLHALSSQLELLRSSSAAPWTMQDMCNKACEGQIRQNGAYSRRYLGIVLSKPSFPSAATTCIKTFLSHSSHIFVNVWQHFCSLLIAY